MLRIAILDDYQNVSLEMADWSPLAGRATITVFNDHLSNLDDIVARLLPFDVVVAVAVIITRLQCGSLMPSARRSADQPQ